MTLRHVAAAVLLLAACHKPDAPSSATPSTAPRAAPPAAAQGSGEVAVEVNGVAITRDELGDSARNTSPHGAGAAESENDTLQRVVLDELVAQRAVQLGLDQDATYREALRQAEARHRVWKRNQLVALFEHWQDGQRSTISEADARAYFAAHEADIRAEVRVGQILVRDEAAANQCLHDLQSGTAFDDVARRLVPVAATPNERPWELPFMRWVQVPEAWRAPLQALQPGQTTGILRGPNHRFWILKLLDRRGRPELTFESVRDEISQTLQAERAVSVRAGLRDDLRRHAQVNYHVQGGP